MTSCWRCCDCGEFVHEFCNHCWTVDIDQQQDRCGEVGDGILPEGLHVGFQEGSCSSGCSSPNTRYDGSAYGSDLHSLPNLASLSVPSSWMVMDCPTVHEDGCGTRIGHGLVTTVNL